MSYLQEAWLDELNCEPYANLPDAERQVRDAAMDELLADAVGAVHAVDLIDGLDEMHALLSWIDDPAVWRPRGE